MSITPQTLLRFTVGAAITAVVLFLMWYFSSIVIYILVSAVLAIMGRPLVARISRGRIGRWRVPRWCGALVTLLVIWIVFAVMCGLFVPLVTNKLYQLAHLDFSTVLTSVEEPLQRIQDYLTHFFSLPETQVSFKDTLILFLQSLINFDTINTAFSSVVSLAVSSVIAFFSISFITFFFLRDDGLFYAMVTALFPDRYQQNVTHALNSVTVLLFRYFRGIFGRELPVDVGRIAGDDGFRHEGAGCLFHRSYHGGYERRAIRRSDHRRCCFGLHGYHHPDRRDVDRPYDAGHCRIAVDFEGAG